MSSSIAPATLFGWVKSGENNDAIAEILETMPESREALLLITYLVRRSYEYPPESDDQLMDVLLWAETALEPFSLAAQAWAMDEVAGHEIANGRMNPALWQQARSQSLETVLITTGT